MPDDLLLARLLTARCASRIIEQDASVFAEPGSDAYAIVGERLGWIRAPVEMRAHLPDIDAFTAGARADGLTDIYLLGMGGSSLCAEVLRDVPPPPQDGMRLTVLDTTDERVIREATAALSPHRSLFIVASKSGSTIEVASLERHFWARMTGSLSASAGAHFVAVTDPQTPLASRAAEMAYRRTFVNPPDIGGRYSALSLFGLVPAGLMGLDLRALLESAARMVERCRADDAGNPGLALGAFMAEQAAAGRDALTLILPPALAPLGAWIEQLVAESTGKNGRGVLPVVGEPIGAASDYGATRAFVSVTSDREGAEHAAADALEAAGHPVFRIQTSPADLGAEFFRWEFATAVAGAALEVNPFDEPNVRDAKQRTQQQLEAWMATGAFRLDPPYGRSSGSTRREHRPTRGSEAVERRRYVAVLDYLPVEPDRGPVIERLRVALRRRSGMATTYGVGPRYLHSTGQYHKGGPNSGLFLLFTAADATSTPVPGEAFSFSTLKHAQALGDFEALVAAGRDVIHFHLEDPAADFSAELERLAIGQ